MKRYFADAFTGEGCKGNRACVVDCGTLADGWPTDEEMMSQAKENALPETAFFLRDGDKFRLRWFTPDIEMDLCGHATLATAFVISSLEDYRGREVVFDTCSGTVKVAVARDGMLTLVFPSRPAKSAELPQNILDSLRYKPLEVGLSRDYILLYDSPEKVRDMSVDRELFDKCSIDPGGVIFTAKSKEGADCDFVSRFFTPQATILEDPVTGSAHCTLIPFWSGKLGKKKMVARQISEQGGILHCEDCGPLVRISGYAKKVLLLFAILSGIGLNARNLPSKWKMQKATKNSFEMLWEQNSSMIRATECGEGYVDAPKCEKMVEGDTWTFHFPVKDLKAGSYFEFDIMLGSSEASPRYYALEYKDGKRWKSAGIVKGYSGSSESTALIRTFRLEKAIKEGEVLVRLRVAGNEICKKDAAGGKDADSHVKLKPYGYIGAYARVAGENAPLDTLKVGYLGNSFTFVNCGDFILKELAWEEGHYLDMHVNTYPGAYFRTHLALEGSMDVISEGGYDWFILQDQSQQAVKFGKDTTKSIMDYTKTIASVLRYFSPEARILYEQTWAYSKSDFGGAGSFEAFDWYSAVGAEKLAAAAGAGVSPIAQAFAVVRDERPDIEIYSTDFHHPAAYGAYLKACCNYLCIFGVPFKSDKANFALDPDICSYLRKVAERCCLEKSITMSTEQYLADWYGDADPASCRPTSYFLEKMAEFNSQPAQEGCTVLLGDSLTDFGDWSVYLPGENVINRGIAGDKIEGMCIRLDEIIRHNPSKIFLLAGTNNLVKHSKANYQTVLPLLKTLISRIRQKMPEAQLYVQSILPQNPVSIDWSDHFNADVEALNKALAEMAQEYGYTYLDIATPMKDADGFLRSDCTIDGCHLSDSAFRLWSDMLKAKLR